MNSQVRVELDRESSLTLLENSELNLPFIGELNLQESESAKIELGEVGSVFLKRGSVRVDAQGSSQREYQTPVTKNIYTHCQILLTYEPETANAEATVFAGQISFRGENGEVARDLSVGQKAQFRGRLEEGEPAFDILLQGRRVARGELGPVQNLAAKELAELQKSTFIEKPPPPKPLPKHQPKPGEICKEPFAKMNECAWWYRADSKSCERKICSAQGEWTDSFIYPQGEGPCVTLGTKPLRGACDY